MELTKRNQSFGMSLVIPGIFLFGLYMCKFIYLGLQTSVQLISVAPLFACTRYAKRDTAQQAILSLWWAYGRTFSASKTRTFRSRSGSVQYQIGSSLAELVNSLSANKSIWVRSLYRIIKDLDLEQFIHWLSILAMH